MEELTTGTVRVIRKAWHAAKQFHAGSFPPRQFTSDEMSDAVNELKKGTTPSNEYDANIVIDMLLSAESIYCTLRAWYSDTDWRPSMTYDYTLDEYREAVQRLGIPVGGENQ